MSEDGALRERFAALRREELSETPPLAALLERRHRVEARRGAAPGGHRVPLRAAAAGVGLAVLAALLVLPPPPVEDRPRSAREAGRLSGRDGAREATAVTDWRAPTDFLLHTPGEEVLGPPPALGGGLLSGASLSGVRMDAPTPAASSESPRRPR